MRPEYCQIEHSHIISEKPRDINPFKNTNTHILVHSRVLYLHKFIAYAVYRIHSVVYSRANGITCSSATMKILCLI